MATKKFSVTVDESDTVTAAILELLRQVGANPEALENETTGTERMLRPCQVCDELFDEESLETTKELALSDVEKACPICVGAANRVWARFKEAATKEANEIRRQLPQIVKDIRAGAPYPDYYRGLE